MLIQNIIINATGTCWFVIIIFLACYFVIFLTILSKIYRVSLVVISVSLVSTTVPCSSIFILSLWVTEPFYVFIFSFCSVSLFVSVSSSFISSLITISVSLIYIIVACSITLYSLFLYTHFLPPGCIYIYVSLLVLSSLLVTSSVSTLTNFSLFLHFFNQYYFHSINVTFCIFNQCCLIDLYFHVSDIYYIIMFDHVHIPHFYIIVYFFFPLHTSFWSFLSIFCHYVLILIPWKIYFIITVIGWLRICFSCQCHIL